MHRMQKVSYVKIKIILCKVSSGPLLYINTFCSILILLADSEGPNQIVRMRRLIWAFVVRICSKTRFGMTRPL